MLQRLIVRDGQTEEQARARFDADLGVSAWALPGRERREIEPGVWMPTRLTLRGDVRAIFRKALIDYVVEWFDYRRVS